MNILDARLLGLIALGSATGGVSRFLLGNLIQGRPSVVFPTGTLLINIVGSLLMGFLARFAMGAPALSPEVRAMLTVGFCGGFTTFSAFSYETVMLIEFGEYRRAGLYVSLSVGLSLVGTLAGFWLARQAFAGR